MRKDTGKYLITMLLTLLLSACSKGVFDVQLKTYEATDTVSPVLKNDGSQGAMQCIADVRLILLSADTLSEHYAGASRINRYIIDELLDGCRNASETEAAQQFVRISSKLLADDMQTMYGKRDEDFDAVFTRRVTTEAHWGFGDNVLCYTLTNDLYEGGAHPVTQTRTLSFSIENGCVIRPSDVFREGTEDMLIERLTNSLMEQYDVESVDELHEMGILDLSDMYISDDMLLESDGIVFHYDPYELAPYALGSIEIRLSYTEVEDLLRSTEP
ncbi:MAG: RsiV family protein [Bacteroidaceae bacterium]|nr:RsiV family protein [Bacteroidaceae bacterium]